MNIELFKLGFEMEMRKVAAEPIDVNLIRLLGANENLGEVNRVCMDRLANIPTGPGGTTRGEIPKKPLQTYPQYEKYMQEKVVPYQARFKAHLGNRQLSEPQMAALTSMAWRYPAEADRIATMLGQGNDAGALAEWRSPRATMTAGKPNQLIQARNNNDAALFEKGWDAQRDDGRSVADYVRGKINRQTWNGKPISPQIAPDPHNLRDRIMAKNTAPSPAPGYEIRRPVVPTRTHTPVPQDPPGQSNMAAQPTPVVPKPTASIPPVKSVTPTLASSDPLNIEYAGLKQ